MLTKIRTLQSHGYWLVFIASLLFILYIGYMQLLHDDIAVAETKLAARIEAIETKAATNAAVTVPPEYYGLKRAEVALAELRKGVEEETPGCNCGPRVDVYTEGLHAQWCTMFASWVAKEAGSPVRNDKTNSWKIENSRDFAEYLEANGTWYSRDEIIEQNIQPQIGDYMVFWRGDFDDELGHVDIVVELGEEPGFAGFVGGNLRNKVKYRYYSYQQQYGFMGFGRPEKEAN